ncbi:MAG: hypothetical protein QOI86_1041 [Actinomycetota bacterium]|jgi:hypothetical protein|nr:hypothetical protein [Actinomycetota bacterium]
MTNPNPDDTHLVDAVTTMTAELVGLRADTDALRGYGRRNRHLIKLMAVSVVVDVALSFGLAYAVYKADDASGAASRAASAQVVTCRSSNAARAVQTDLWNFILNSFPPPVGETPAARTQRETTTAKFKVYVASAFAQRDCEALLDGAKQ